jgi:capsular polysaccharide biosynthesis protein
MREPNIFEEALLPTAPVTPHKMRDIIIGFLLGALLAAAVVTIKFLSDDRILSGEDVAKVGGLTTLGMIPLQELDGGADEDGRKKGRKKRESKERKGE